MENKIFGRTPSVENKYQLIGSDLKHLVLVSRDKLGEPRFWRNDVVKAWCISACAGMTMDDDSFWIGIYDEPYYNRDVRAHFTSYGGMCRYEPTKFYKPGEINCRADLEIQEKALEILNGLLDDGVIAVVRPDGTRIGKRE